MTADSYVCVRYPRVAQVLKEDAAQPIVLVIAPSLVTVKSGIQADLIAIRERFRNTTCRRLPLEVATDVCVQELLSMCKQKGFSKCFIAYLGGERDDVFRSAERAHDLCQRTFDMSVLVVERCKPTNSCCLPAAAAFRPLRADPFQATGHILVSSGTNSTAYSSSGRGSWFLQILLRSLTGNWMEAIKAASACLEKIPADGSLTDDDTPLPVPAAPTVEQSDWSQPLASSARSESDDPWDLLEDVA